MNSFEFECESRKCWQLKSWHETQKSVWALRESVQNVAQIFVERTSKRTERESSSLSEEIMKSRRENDVWEVW